MPTLPDHMLDRLMNGENVSRPSVCILRVSVTFEDGSIQRFSVDGDTTVQEFVRAVENNHDTNARFKKMEVLEMVERPTGVVRCA